MSRSQQPAVRRFLNHSRTVGEASRAPWLTVKSGLQTFECADDVKGRKKFVARLEALRQQVESKECGKAEVDGQTLNSRLNRGWYWGCEAFKEKLLLKLGKDGMAHRKDCGADSFQQDHGELQAKKLLEAGLRHYGLRVSVLKHLPSGDKRKAEIAAVVFGRTGVSQGWLARQPAISSTAYVSQLISRHKKSRGGEVTWQNKN